MPPWRGRRRHAGRQLADFVKEERPSLDELEAAEPSLHGTCEGALLVPEDQCRGIATQLTLTNTRDARRDRAWMARARAMRSFPVPVSPLMSTVESVGAATAGRERGFGLGPRPALPVFAVCQFSS
jgi:hypothetical protein